MQEANQMLMGNFRIGLISLVICVFSLDSGVGQELRTTRLENGLLQLESVHLRLITDMPISEPIESLPRIFDQAMSQWRERFDVDIAQTREVIVTAYLMVDRSRFIQLKLMPPQLESFRHGYQLDDCLYLTDQPSDYYRRHLLLHEGTHWFLWKFLKGNGPPWYSEGICELLGTHLWENQQLRLGVIPEHRDSFPYWGRLKLIRESIDNKTAPSLNAILNFSDTAHRTDEPYAWSWAAMVFFSNHPQYQKMLRRLAQPPLDYSNRITVDLKRELNANWSIVDAEWRLFLSELDYGYLPINSLVDLNAVPVEALKKTEKRFVRSDRGWQSTGVAVERGQKIRMEATGKIVVRSKNQLGSSSEWSCEPQGITLEYREGNPLGSLMAMVVPIKSEFVDAPLVRLTGNSIGRGKHWIAPESGILLLKINEPSGQLADNAGEFTVTMEPSAS